MNKTPYQLSKVYEYGCLPPSKEEETKIFAQLRLAKAYYNHLISIEKEARSLFSASLGKLIPEYSITISNLESAKDKLEKAREAATLSRTGTRKTDASLADAFKNAKAEVKSLTKLLAEIKANNKEALAVAADEANTFRNEASKEARFWFGPKMGGLCWRTTGTYEKAAKQASKAKFLSWSRFDGQGCIGGQVYGHTPVPAIEVWNNKTLAIKEIPEEVYMLPRGERKKASRTVVRFRISSTQWVSLPMIMHRPLSKDSVITEVRLTVSQVAGKAVYKLLLTLGFKEVKPNYNTAICGLDIGWAMEDPERAADGSVLTVGAIATTDEVSLISLDVSKHLHAQSKQASVDAKYDLVKHKLSTELGLAVPTRSRKKIKNLIAKHKSPTQEMLDFVKEYKHDLYVDHLRQDAREQRKHHYRKIAAELAKTCGFVAVEKINLANMGKQGELGNTAAKSKLNWQLKAAAVGELRLALQNVGLQIIEVDPAYTSQTCSQCGTIDAASRSSRSTFCCTRCGFSVHADVNAAINIRNRGCESLGAAKPTAPSRISIISNTYKGKARGKYVKITANTKSKQGLLENWKLTG